MKKLLILGASGLIGGHIVRYYLQQGVYCTLITTIQSRFKNLDDIKKQYNEQIEYKHIADFASDEFNELVCSAVILFTLTYLICYEYLHFVNHKNLFIFNDLLN